MKAAQAGRSQAGEVSITGGTTRKGILMSRSRFRRLAVLSALGLAVALVFAAGPAAAVTAPLILKLAPASAPQAGGSTVTITGRSLIGVTKIAFGQSEATKVQVVSCTTLRCKAPAGTGTVSLRVYKDGLASNALSFRYVPAAPVVTGLEPASGPSVGGTPVTITGSSFKNVRAVIFGTTPAVSFTVGSATSITAVSPPGAGNVAVIVRTAKGTSAQVPAAVFTYSDASGRVGQEGGTVEVTDQTSPIFGAKVFVPEGAVPEGESVTVTMDHTDYLPGPVDEGVVQSTKGIVLTKDPGGEFNLPVQVTIPYSTEGADPEDIPGVFYWDEELDSYVACSVLAIDASSHTVTFQTSHFSWFVGLTVKGLTKALGMSAGNVYADSGFRAARDGFFHPNIGTFKVEGNCLGMAMYSAWYYRAKAKTGADAPLANKYREGDPALWEDDALAREVIGRSYSFGANIWSTLLSGTPILGLAKALTAQELVTALIVTKQPQVLNMGRYDDLNLDPELAHAVVVDRFQDGRFYIYDSNFPGEEVTLDFSLLQGLTNYSKAAAYGGQPQTYSMDATATYVNDGRFRSLYDAAEAGFPSSIYNTIDISTPLLDRNEAVLTQQEDSLQVTGIVSGGQVRARGIVVSVNGSGPKGGLSGDVVALNDDGSFSFTITGLPFGSSVVRMYSTTNVGLEKDKRPHAYAGYRQFTVRYGSDAGLGSGFESGDWGDWAHETHTWGNTTPNSAPDKSAIVARGNDPVFPSLSTVYKGDYAARINNSDPSYHISTMSRNYVVPTDGASGLIFHWAAVLEDPSHDAANQPYFRISVTDESSGSVLYSKYHYSNDPSYSGWQTVQYGGSTWRAIPWQYVYVDLSSARGHEVTLRVEAADCGYGAHGGYVYIDGE